jgi:ABC-type transport system involved in multi-copper enzyme maturation permease subunit
MAVRVGLGPVFHYEWLLASRRWQLYAGRALFLLALLTAVFIVWCANLDALLHPSLRNQARVGESIFYALLGTQLALVLLAAPAATAGAVCLDRARGNLAHLLITDLSGAEIVLGKLAARLLPVLGLLLATLPVLALSILVGGLDPVALAGAFLVTLGVAILGCALALLLSVWGQKTHEVLLVNYLLWTAFLLAYPVWDILDREALGGMGLGPPPWLLHTNPFWLAFAPYAVPGTDVLGDCVLFLAGCLALSVVVVAAAVLVLRWVAVHPAVGRTRGQRPPRPPLFGPSLDANPVLWREWHRRRPSRWVAVVWRIYAAAAVLLTGLALVLVAMHGGRHGEFPALVNAFEVTLGLLLVSITSSTSLAEERLHGSLDVLLTTPLPTRAIVWGKWWGAYRTVLLLTVLPAVVTAALVLGAGQAAALPLVVGLVLAYGAALTSLGLALAVLVRRLGRALAGTVIAYVVGAVAWPVLVFTLAGRYEASWLAMGSPFWGIGLVSVWAQEGRLTREGVPSGALGWMVFYGIAAVVLYAVARGRFDRCLGRACQGPRRPVSGGHRPPAAALPSGY